MESPLISSITVKGLFGLYSYRLPVTGQLSDTAILYGDNGLGKSTILRLAFHLLSSGRNRGHQLTLFNAPFRDLEVLLGSGIAIRALKGKSSDDKMTLSVRRGRSVLATWRYRPTGTADQWKSTHTVEPGLFGEIDVWLKEHASHSSSGKPKEGEEAFLETLRESAPLVFILNADRRLDSDAVPDASDELELRRTLQLGEPKRIRDLVLRSREIALTQALASAAKWIGRQVFRGANQGSTNVHTVYANVLKHLTTKQSLQKQGKPIDPNALIDRLAVIQALADNFAKYELSAALPTADFVSALRAKAPTKRATAGALLLPYIEGLEGRLQALEGVYNIVDRFVTSVNGFLQDKEVSYRASAGFRITNRLGRELKASDLSSGEQQLLLLFCYVLTARDVPSVFMIDEPEISLNIKWQRQLVQALRGLTSQRLTQFVFASHSMELIAQHHSRLVQLSESVIDQ